MKQHIESLSTAEIADVVGGDWDWGDFWAGATWTLGAGCYVTGHPALCFGSMLTGGLFMYF
jgi:hypothetical protein